MGTPLPWMWEVSSHRLRSWTEQARRNDKVSLVPAPPTYTSWSAETGARGLHAVPCITWWSSLLKSQVKRTLPPSLNPAHEKMQTYRLFLEDNSGTVSNDFLWETVPGEQDSDHSLKVWGGQLWDRGIGCRASGSAAGWGTSVRGEGEKQDWAGTVE